MGDQAASNGGNTVSNPSADISFDVSVSDCTTEVDVVCEAPAIFDCDAEANKQGEIQIEQLVGHRIANPIRAQVGSMFSYAGPNNSPYWSPPSTPCDVNDAGCQNRIRWHDLPASLTRLSYGWFANAF